MHFRSILAASAAVLLTAAAAPAAEVAALSGDNTISIVDTSAKKVVKTWNISGASVKIAGIDVRPADGKLYALAADGNLYTVDISSGKATMKSKLETMIPSSAWATVDFNPAADRLRVIGSDGTSLRVNVDDGKVTKDGSLKYAEGDASKGKTPKVVAGAYSNSFKGTKETTLYDIDASTGALLRQVPPNDGTLNTIGMLGVQGEVYAFDIWSDGQGKNEAWLMAADGLHSVDLASGKAGPAIKIEGLKGQVRDIAILPAM
jgi:outer membrane protein assembly factor BamB